MDTVDYFNNNKVFPRLRSLLLKDYFRFYRVNLHKQCPFWEDDSKCAMRFCSVSPCADTDIPRGLRELRERDEDGEIEEAPYEKVSVVESDFRFLALHNRHTDNTQQGPILSQVFRGLFACGN